MLNKEIKPKLEIYLVNFEWTQVNSCYWKGYLKQDKDITLLFTCDNDIEEEQSWKFILMYNLNQLFIAGTYSTLKLAVDQVKVMLTKISKAV